MSTLEAYVSDPSQRQELVRLIQRGVHEDEPSIAVLVRGGTDATRRILTEAIATCCNDEPGKLVQTVYFCSWGAFIASTCGRIYISASCREHVCHEPCLAFIKEKGHPVIYIDCDRMLTESEQLMKDLEKC